MPDACGECDGFGSNVYYQQVGMCRRCGGSGEDPEHYRKLPAVIAKYDLQQAMLAVLGRQALRKEEGR